MSKISIIIGREYKTRVMKKSFILLTFLTPLLFGGMISLIVWLGQIKDNERKIIYVVDRSESLKPALKNNDAYSFRFVDKTVESMKTESKDNKEFTALLYVNADPVKNANAVTLYSEKQVGLELQEYITGQLNTFIEQKRLAAYNIPNLKKMVEDSRSDLKIKTIKWSGTGKDKEASAEVALVIGMITAFLIYMFIVAYGAQVMSGVVQEKTNRIVEVIVSSVKPFELMMGKIIGIALVGLTQFFMWIVLTFIIFLVGTLLFAGSVDPQMLKQASEIGTYGVGQPHVEPSAVQQVFGLLSGVDFVQTIVLFVIYFLGGYLLYASLFAAFGSAVDNETDTQQFSLPLMLPIIFSIYAGIFAAQNPDGPLAFWCSMIPFTSPIVMMVRLPFDVPLWQILLSVALLVGSFIGTTWVSGKIYRTGILMYGKKITWKEMWKWVKY